MPPRANQPRRRYVLFCLPRRMDEQLRQRVHALLAVRQGAQKQQRQFFLRGVPPGRVQPGKRTRLLPPLPPRDVRQRVRTDCMLKLPKGQGKQYVWGDLLPRLRRWHRIRSQGGCSVLGLHPRQIRQHYGVDCVPQMRHRPSGRRLGRRTLLRLWDRGVFRSQRQRQVRALPRGAVRNEQRHGLRRMRVGAVPWLNTGQPSKVQEVRRGRNDLQGGSSFVRYLRFGMARRSVESRNLRAMRGGFVPRCPRPDRVQDLRCRKNCQQQEYSVRKPRLGDGGGLRRRHRVFGRFKPEQVRVAMQAVPAGVGLYRPDRRLRDGPRGGMVAHSVVFGAGDPLCRVPARHRHL